MRKSANKSFVRIVDYVRHAAMDYNRHNAFDPFKDDPRYISFHHIRVYDERNDLNEVAHMVFMDDNNNRWVVTITEYDE
jgi:hypothetical protein